MEKEVKKILFVDDDNFLRKVYDSELSELGYEVILAADGEDGLKLAQTKNAVIIERKLEKI